jgi:hypothetical protein
MSMLVKITIHHFQQSSLLNGLGHCRDLIWSTANTWIFCLSHCLALFLSSHFFGLSNNTLFKGKKLPVVFYFLFRKKRKQIYLLRKVVCLFCLFVMLRFPKSLCPSPCSQHCWKALNEWVGTHLEDFVTFRIMMQELLSIEQFFQQN